ncbi:RHS repeat-associated core domain-containing protein, partial [Lonsdalea quercina]|uniref:RHS repeat-associated core domain-containing protein n=1 Tax=Lonsdalea quercina TaxID=71657 RepID=UPI003975C85F
PELAFAGQLRDSESGLCYNRFRYYDPAGGGYISPDPIGVLGGESNYAYVHNPSSWVDPLGLSECSAYTGKLSVKSSEMKPLVKGSKEWNQAVKDAKIATSNSEKFQVKVRTSSDAKAFLKETQGNMNRYKAHTQSGRADGVPKYPKGYEQHMGPEGGFGDTPHIKWYNNGTDGHIFYDIPN